MSREYLIQSDIKKIKSCRFINPQDKERLLIELRKQEQRAKERCFADQGKSCLCLKWKSCVYCPFFKPISEVNMANVYKAHSIIESEFAWRKDED